MNSNTNAKFTVSRTGYAGATVFVKLLLFFFVVCFASGEVVAEELQTFSNCKLIETEWSDGDSFLVELEDGRQFTVRLYGVDCVEYHVTDTTDARRLRSQRRYFGISGCGDNATSSIKAAKQFGADAKAFVEQKLAAPFAVSTTFADARGDGKHKRYYAFISSKNGKDLGEELVRNGLARAFGVNRTTPDGKSRDEHREWLSDVELQAAQKGSGVWAVTDWETLPAERQLERQEEAELALAAGNQPLSSDEQLDLNTAPRDELMRLPGVGEVLANRIIENRPYRTIEEVSNVDGIGERKLQDILPSLKLSVEQQ